MWLNKTIQSGSPWIYITDPLGSHFEKHGLRLHYGLWQIENTQHQAGRMWNEVSCVWPKSWKTAGEYQAQWKYFMVLFKNKKVKDLTNTRGKKWEWIWVSCCSFGTFTIPHYLNVKTDIITNDQNGSNTFAWKEL